MDRERILIDTSILIDHLRKPRKQETVFFQLIGRYDFLITSVTEFEFAVGATPNDQEYIQQLIAGLPVLPFDSASVRSAVAISRELKTRNQLIALPGIFIAATAIAYDLALLTLNPKHFERVQTLKLVASAQ